LRIPAIQRRAVRFLSELDVAYPKSPLSVTGPDAEPYDYLRPGDRVGRGVFGLAQHEIGADGRFTVVGAAADISMLRDSFPALIGQMRGSAKPGLWLIRPDGYLGYCGAVGDLAGAGNYLRKIA
jgi:hypothetical protein